MVLENMNGMIQKYFLRYEPGFSPLFEMCVILGYMGHDRYPSQLRVSCLQLIVILLPICQLSVHCPLSSVHCPVPSPGYCGGSKAVVRCGLVTTGHTGPWSQHSDTGDNIYLSLYFLFIRNIPRRNKPNL